MSRKPYLSLLLHCTATREGSPVTKELLEQWHKSPKDLPDGKVVYLGKTYPSRKDLPDDKINGKSIRTLSGRGWRRLGYSAMIHLDGRIEVLSPWNFDGWIDDGEITNGAEGMNGTTRHFVYVGGLDSAGKPKDTRTPAQLAAMEKLVRDEIQRHPAVRVGGHNEVANKACPCFSVPEWLSKLGIPKENWFALRKG